MSLFTNWSESMKATAGGYNEVCRVLTLDNGVWKDMYSNGTFALLRKGGFHMCFLVEER